MNDELESDDARRAREALAGLGGVPPVDPAFRARLRREFASGTLAPALPAVPPVVRLPRSRSAAASAWGWAAAAAAIAVVSAAVLNPGPAWRIASVSGADEVTVDGRRVPTTDPLRLAAVLVPGAKVSVPAGAVLEIVSERFLAIQMSGGAEAVVPRVPGRWFQRTVDAKIEAGEWRITTGSGFPGARFKVTTPAAQVEVTGTTLAVICQPEGTCVCVYEGHVKVGRDASDMATVVSGRRRYVYADPAKTPLDDDMLAPERPALGEFCETMRGQTHRPR